MGCLKTSDSPLVGLDLVEGIRTKRPPKIQGTCPVANVHLYLLLPFFSFRCRHVSLVQGCPLVCLRRTPHPVILAL